LRWRSERHSGDEAEKFISLERDEEPNSKPARFEVMSDYPTHGREDEELKTN
jgi:hypothetical protein